MFTDYDRVDFKFSARIPCLQFCGAQIQSMQIKMNRMNGR